MRKESPSSFSRLSRLLLLAGLFCGVLLPCQAQTSDAYIVIDSRTGKILAAKNPNDKLEVANLTNVVTACVTLDWIIGSLGLPESESERKRLESQALGQVITIPASALSFGSPNPLQFQAGDQLSIRDALNCVLLASDSIAAHALAENIGNAMKQNLDQASAGSLFGKARSQTGEEFFVGQMNALAKRLAMNRSTFVNAHGLDQDKPRGFSTAADMARIAVYALEKPSFNFIVSQTERAVSYLRNGQEVRYLVHNTNKLVGTLGVDGVKTGRSARAGDCLMTRARKDDKIQMLEGNRRIRTPYHLVLVTLNSTDRFGQTAQLINAGWQAYESWLAAGLPVKAGDRLDLVRITQ